MEKNLTISPQSLPTKKLKVVGFDPSLRNWGIAVGHLWLQDSRHLEVNFLDIVQPELPKSKQVRQNSLDLETARLLSEGVLRHLTDVDAVFVEVPVGSQSARAMASYGVCVGILGAIRAMGIPFFEVSPEEVKRVAVGTKIATKAQMIEWAVSKYPDINWPTCKNKGVTQVVTGKAEHMADAIAAIHAGISCQPFQQLLSMLKTTS